ncbi:MAG: alpha/beta hydrolase [Candidatus Tectomicrobia bacterium]|nr:alpha/beta hydrolase [Candidatus Tectomicrobia bacterium]
MSYEPLKKQLSIDGMIMHYWEWESEGLPIVMLHPTSGYGRMWEPIARLLHPDYRILGLDQRGHGDTGRLKGDYSAETFAADLDACVTALGIRKFALTGHSLGSRVGMIYTSLHPEKVSHLIMVAGPHYASLFDAPEDVEEGRVGRERMKDRQVKFASKDEAIASIKAARPTVTDEVAQHMVQYNMHHSSDGSVEWKYDLEAAIETLSHIPDNLTPYVKKIRCPILIPWGNRPRDLTPERIPLVKPLFPTAQWVFIEKGEYFIYQENPEKLAQAIREFLGQQE